MSQNRRVHYRVTPDIERDVRVFAVTPGSQSHQVGLIDISAGGISFAVSSGHGLQAQVGSKLLLRFEASRLNNMLEIPSTLRRIEEADGNFIYGVEFNNWVDDRFRLAPQLRSLFNEREAVRVEPPEGDELDVRLAINGETPLSPGLLRDISVLGVGIWLNDDEHHTVSSQDAITIGLHLDNKNEEVQLEVRVRHTHTVGDRIRLGVEICEDQPHRGLAATQKRIMKYVMQRQIEAARIDAERRRAMREHYPTS